MKKLSVIIVNYNVQHFLHTCLQSVFQALKNISSEVIVVDNHSSDGSCEMIMQQFPQVRLVANKVNVGFSKANNQGVSLATGEFVLILNPDTILAEHTLENCIQFAQEQVNFGALGVRLIDGTGIFLHECKRNIPTPKRAFFKLISNANEKLGYYANQVNQSQNAEIEILGGAFMLMKKEVYQTLTGFDERFFMYGEDIDLSYRLLKSGYKNYYLGTEMAIHFKGESTQKDVKYLKYFFGAMKLFYQKHIKVNKLVDIFMQLGIHCWFLLKYFSLLFLKEKESDNSVLLYVGKSKNAITNIVALNPLSKLIVVDPVFFTESKFENQFNIIDSMVTCHFVKEIIFDSDALSFSSIIHSMYKLHKKAITFKIKPRNGEFIIGSNCAIGKGFVEKF